MLQSKLFGIRRFLLHAICFSAHAYIDMCIKYYRRLNQVPAGDTWLAMNTCMEEYIDSVSQPDMLLKDIMLKMIDFVKENNLQSLQIERAKRLLHQSGMSSDRRPTGCDDDELPLYEKVRILLR